MANHKSVIVVQRPGEKIAAAYVNILCKDFPTYMGVAAVENGKLVTTAVRGPPKPEQFEEITKALGSSHIAFTVGKAGHDFLDEDMQPYVLLRNKDGDPICVGLFDGNFEGYSVVKSTHIDEYHLVNDVLIPKMKKIYKLVDEKIVDLIAELKDPDGFSNGFFNNCWTNRGNITLFTAEADPITFSGGNLIKEGKFNWGWTSDAFNYKEQTVAKTEAEKPMSMLEKLKAKAASTAAAVTAVTGPVEEKKTETAIETVAKVMEEYEDVRLPAEADAAGDRWPNKRRVEWWVTEIGYKPEGYKERSTVVKRKKGTKMGLLHPLLAEKAKEEAIAKGQATPLPAENNAPAASSGASEAVVEHVKDTSVKNNVTTAYMPILSPKQKINLKTSWLKDAEMVKILGDDYKEMNDPKLLKEMEENYATFWDGLGLTEEIALSFEAICKLGEADLKALAVYAFNKQNEATKVKIKLRSIIADPKQRIAM